YQGALVIVCDTANQERICDQRYHLGDFLIKIDHHPNDDPYGDIQWVDTAASSTSEMIYELYLAGKDEGFRLNTRGARLLYAGIVGDTGRFLYQSATEKTFQYASELIQYPFSRAELYEQMYAITENLAKLQGVILQNFVMDEYGLAKIMIPKKLMESYQLTPQEVARLVSSIGNIKGLLAWAFFIEEEEGQIRVRLRSKGPVINGVAKKFNGGGHPLASGATIFSWDEVDLVMKELQKVAKHYLEKQS
ncbi:MAG: bifunctional oligoribonuclease/PAP phosphatase NrnA, partial [Caldibacillus sp.]